MVGDLGVDGASAPPGVDSEAVRGPAGLLDQVVVHQMDYLNQRAENLEATNAHNEAIAVLEEQKRALRSDLDGAASSHEARLNQLLTGKTLIVTGRPQSNASIPGDRRVTLEATEVTVLRVRVRPDENEPTIIFLVPGHEHTLFGRWGDLIISEPESGPETLPDADASAGMPSS